MKSRVPPWYRNAKLGIMVHWGLPSVPAFAPAGNGSISEILSSHDWRFYFHNNPYSEWYQNSLRLGDTAVADHHKQNFKRGYSYESFADRFNDDIKKWQPGEWAELFAEAGARYVVLVAKHHDGFLLWPSEHRPARAGYVASRDIVGELADAVRERELHYGLYYSGLLDWTVQNDPIGGFEDLLTVPTDRSYTEYVWRHYSELITRHRPDILWNDIGLPPDFDRAHLFSFYRDCVNDGVLNDRWMQVPTRWRRALALPWLKRKIVGRAKDAIVSGQPLSSAGDVPTAEYARTTRLRREPWEAVRSIGNSFAYNREEPAQNYLSGEDLAVTLADVVSKNGNLLLNLGPKSDGTIPAEQRLPLLDLAAWLRTNGEAIYDTRPWYRAEGETGDGQPVRFTTGPDALYAILLERPSRLTVELRELDLKRIPQSGSSRKREDELSVSLLGCEQPVQWRLTEQAVEVRFPGSFVPVGPPVIRFQRQSAITRARPIEMYTDVIG